MTISFLGQWAHILLRNRIITSKTSVNLKAFLTSFLMLPVDPSRPGMHNKLIKYLLELGAPRIVYISCNPATCARDLDLLCHNEVCGFQSALLILHPLSKFVLYFLLVMKNFSMMMMIDYTVEINQFGDVGIGMSGPRLKGASTLQTVARSTSWHVPSNATYWMHNHPWQGYNWAIMDW